MSSWIKQYAIIFFLGFTAVAIALGLGAISGEFWSQDPVLVALRACGTAFMLGGLVLWAMYNRDLSNKANMNPLFGLLVAAGCLMGLTALLGPQSALSGSLGLGAIILNSVAVIVVLAFMIFDPAQPEPLTTSWPGGQLKYPGPDGHLAYEDHDEHEDHDEAHHETASIDDLTIIEGVGPRMQEIFTEVGITAFAHIASKSPDELKQILRDGGFRAPVVATSWPAQAALAAQENMVALQALQESLKAGRFG